ncbi:transposable element Tcb2 transposase [Trichonephila clavipes]|nr:transposable element Tcb2 transposase [Trichonephila clavipes]
MVWGAIAYNTRSPLEFIRDTMTAQRYVHDILQPHVLPLMQRPPGAIFQQDYVWFPTASVPQDCLRTVTKIPSYTRTFDDGPRHFETWSSDENDILGAIPRSSNYPTIPTGGRLRSRLI